MKISMASDHAGYECKEIISKWLKEEGYQILDFGPFSDESVDYPDFAYPGAEAVSAKVADMGVLICGSGTGMTITANKVAGIRAALCYNIDMAKLARQHNNANIITLGARMNTIEEIKAMVSAFLTEKFEGGRHQNRIDKVHALTGC